MSQPIKLKKLPRVSGIPMSILPPLGVIPRVMQAQELCNKEKIQKAQLSQMKASLTVLAGADGPQEIVKGPKPSEIIVVNPHDSLKSGTLVATSEPK